MLKTIKKVLVIKLRDIGDIVLSTPVLKVLNENCNAPEIVYVLKKEYAYFKYLLPHVKEVITYDKNDPLDFFRVVIRLWKYKFDLAINLHATFRSALIAFLSGAGFRLVHNHSGRDYFSSVPLGIEEKKKSIIERDLDTLAPLRLEKITSSMKKTELSLNEEYVKYIDDEEITSTIGLGVGARRPVKMWSKDRFVELGRRLESDGFKIAVFCSENEKKTGEYIAAGIGSSTRLYAGLDFLRLSFFINKLRLFAGNDSGLRHIAAALNIKTVTLFGPEDPVEWHPYREEDGHVFILHRLECINCFKDKCPEKHHNCMEFISVDEVYQVIKRIL